MEGSGLNLPKAVSICESITGEGFQGEEQFIPTQSKIFLVERLVDAGFKRIMVSSFSHPAAQPQHRDVEEIYRHIPHRDDVTYLTATPNMRALERAMKCRDSGAAGPDAILFMIGTTEAYNKGLLGVPKDEQLKFIEQAMKVARDAGLKVYCAIIGIWSCVFSGKKVPKDAPCELANRLMALGVDEIHYGEGSAGPVGPFPNDAYEFFSRILKKYPDPKIHHFHYHDKWGFGTSTFLAAMQAGLTQFETSIGGMSGGITRIIDKVPTRGASDPPLDYYISPISYGHVPTEDFVAMCEGMGVKTGIDMDKLLRIGAWVERIVGRKLGSFYLKAGIQRIEG